METRKLPTRISRGCHNSAEIHASFVFTRWDSVSTPRRSKLPIDGSENRRRGLKLKTTKESRNFDCSRFSTISRCYFCIKTNHACLDYNLANFSLLIYLVLFQLIAPRSLSRRIPGNFETSRSVYQNSSFFSAAQTSHGQMAGFRMVIFPSDSIKFPSLKPGQKRETYTCPWSSRARVKGKNFPVSLPASP